MSARFLSRLSGLLLARRWITQSLAVLLLGASIFLGWQWEQRENSREIQQVSAQAKMLAGSLTSALAFHDTVTADEYVNALRLNDGIMAVGVYDRDGVIILGFAREGEVLPDRVSLRDPQIEGRAASVVEPVREGSLRLGHVYIRSAIEPISARISRYVAIGIVLLLAALLIAILGASNAATAAANRALQEQIAGREEAEAALRQAQKMEALGQLTGGVAHDFNNLLMAASSGLELLDRAKTEERREKLKGGIRDALNRGARITEQLLAFSRRRPLKIEIVRIDEQVGKIAELLNHSLRENVDVRFAIAEDVWPVELDSSQFDIAILNLAVNARDAMPKGGEICITARNCPAALAGQDAVEIVVGDEGTGMSAEEIEKAFEPFFTTKGVGRGTGLGLSQVYGFAQSSGGTVSIESELGIGTKVKLMLPRSTAAAPQVASESAALGNSLHGRRVLLVEDDLKLNELLREMLEGEGAHVVAATTAAAGLRLFEEEEIEAIISDMVMPGEMDGLDLARKVRENRADIPIVLMTGFSEAAGAALSEGFPLLRKPFTTANLIAVFTAAFHRDGASEDPTLRSPRS